MPTGPLNRVAENKLAKKLFGWEPKVPFIKGKSDRRGSVLGFQLPLNIKQHIERALLLEHSQSLLRRATAEQCNALPHTSNSAAALQ
jgi:hypothetical protein